MVPQLGDPAPSQIRDEKPSSAETISPSVSLTQALFLANWNVTRSWTKPMMNWAAVLNQLAIRFRTGSRPREVCLASSAY